MLAPDGMSDKLRNETCRDLVEARNAVDRALRKIEGLLMTPLQPDECGQVEDTFDQLWTLRVQLDMLTCWVFPEIDD